MRVANRGVRACVLALLSTLVFAAFARADGRVPRAGERPPPIAGLLPSGGPLCLADSAYFRAWWQDRPGAPGAVAGADGNCATVPPPAAEALAAAEQYRGGFVARGYAPIVGDSPPVFARTAAQARILARLRPSIRARTLGRLTSTTRGRLMAGLTAAQRKPLLRGLPPPLARRMNAELRIALRGRPADFVGGDRRLDIVLDATGASGRLPPNAAGVASCAPRNTPLGRRYIGGNVIVLAPAPAISRTTLAHELFHVVQCNALVSVGDTDLLFMEGTAELLSSFTEPAAFAGSVVDQGNGTFRVTEGAGRVVAFCEEFVPRRTTALDAYDSWPIWDELERTGPGTIRSMMSLAGAGRLPTVDAIIGAVGPERWSAALVAATREVCGNLRAPSGHVAFPAGLRQFIGIRGPAAVPGTPATLTVAPGGVATALATWPANAISVNVRATSASLGPAALVAQAVAVVGAGPLPIGADVTAAVAAVPATSIPVGFAALTVANPSTAAPLTVTVEVAAS